MEKGLADPRVDPRLKAHHARTTAANGPDALLRPNLPTGPLEHLWSPSGLEERDLIITSAPDNNKIFMFYTRPGNTSEALPCVYWMHGGGMQFGSAFDARTLPRSRMLAHLGVAVVSVDFRNYGKAPSESGGGGRGTSETALYPGGLNDCWSGLEYIHTHAAELKIDASRLIIAGVSGGANLTIALAMMAKQRGKLNYLPCGFYAMCPFIAGRWPQDASNDGNLGESHLDSVNNGILFSMSTFQAASDYSQTAFDARDPLAWPGFATEADVKGLPRCVISVNECDPLRDEGVNFYRKCVSAGVDVQCRMAVGTWHAGDLNMDALPEAALETMRSVVHFLQGAPARTSVQAVFNYPCRDAAGVPPKTNKTGDEDPSKETMKVDAVSMPVWNARKRDTPPSLDLQGFELVRHPTEVDFSSTEDVDNRYTKQMEELVKKHTGAERCILFDHTIRKVAQAGAAKGFAVASRGGFAANAVNKVHGDYTAAGAPRRVLELSKPTQSGSFAEPPLTEVQAQEIVAKRRFMIVNVWRNISREAPVKRMPLAMVDCTSVAPGDAFTVELIFKDRVGENLALDQKQEHRWCYFPNMEFEEAILFKTFDNVDDEGVTGKYTIHSAFDDPTTAPEDPTRESIEVRVVAIFPEAAGDGQPPAKKIRKLADHRDHD